ncbi:helix-turn-helix domain-containing protein [Dysgonomonas sp. GY617]|uniref:helix-turn-helix domain-containing protein n=1 Tax=Dysgonomonas sp. GY617 TaxID=2780420 RepID=UPI0018847812|nr:helix-turn-helix domain-containing protein [Dysgonomonas sp. GY617]MBF0575006.1 AraC family transcriptional regulator [Dysgonomonas sp. GY617]
MPIDHLRQIIKSINGNPNCERIAPSESVKNYIEGFYIFSCDDMAQNQLVFNDGLPTIIFFPSITDQIDIQNNGSLITFKTAWINGGIMKSIYVNNLNKVKSILVMRFKSYAFYDIFNLPLHFFRNKCVASLADIGFDTFVLNKIYGEQQNIQRIRQIESYIEQKVLSSKSNALFDAAIGYINEMKGQTSVLDVVCQIGVNYKWLERSFLNCLGISPKEYILLQRFIFAYGNLIESKNKDLTEIALKSGFYDYNHFLKEFKSYTGKTPLDYASNS